MSKSIGDPKIDQETLKALVVAKTAVEAFSKKLADQKTIYNLNMESLVVIEEGLEHLVEMATQCKRRIVKPKFTRFRQSQGGQKAAIQANKPEVKKQQPVKSTVTKVTKVEMPEIKSVKSTVTKTEVPDKPPIK